MLIWLMSICILWKYWSLIGNSFLNYNKKIHFVENLSYSIFFLYVSIIKHVLGTQKNTIEKLIGTIRFIF